MSNLRNDVNMKTSFYQGNPKLKRANVKENLTKWEQREIKRCKSNITYFVENYLKVVHVDRGLVPLELYPYQKELIQHFDDNRFNMVVSARQSGKCVDFLTNIRLKNKQSGKIEDVPIGEFYNTIKQASRKGI